MSAQQPLLPSLGQHEKYHELQQPQHSLKQSATIINKIEDQVKHVKNFQLKPFLEDIITCLSILSAYQYVSISYEHQEKIEQWIGTQIGNKRTEAVLLLIFALYLITLNILQQLTLRYETTPASKPIPDNWQEMQQTSVSQQPSTISVGNRQQLLTYDSYTLIIKQLKSYSIYGFVFILCSTAYAFMCGFNKQQVNFLILWSVTAVVFYSMGKIIGKLIGIRTLHHFGFFVLLIVLSVEIGVAHGFNLFIFL